MTLFVLNNASQPMVGADLFMILGSDSGNLGAPATVPGAFDQVTYGQTQNSFAKDRMNAVVNQFATNPIRVTGVTSAFTLPDGTPITSVGGVTFVPTAAVNAAKTGLVAGTVITVIYDVGACSGAGYCAFDTKNNSIPIPTQIILFHELAHGFHWQNNDFDDANPEPQAEDDENLLRAETVPALPLRDPNNHAGGCGTCVPPKRCFVATAVFGSALAPEVQEFREVRDRLLRTSQLGDLFFSEFYAEYDQFSRRIASDIVASSVLRDTISALLVKPLLEFLYLLQFRVTSETIGATYRGEVEASFRRTITDLAATDPDCSPEDVAGAFSKLGLVSAGTGRGAGVLARAPGRPRDPAAIVSYLNTLLASTGTSHEYVGWGLVVPLKLYWAAINGSLARGEEKEKAIASFVANLDEWLADVPIPPTLDYANEDVAAADLSLLARMAFLSPLVRRRFGLRLLEKLGTTAGCDLRTILEGADYLAGAGDGETHG